MIALGYEALTRSEEDIYLSSCMMQSESIHMYEHARDAYRILKRLWKSIPTNARRSGRVARSVVRFLSLPQQWLRAM